MIYGRLTYLLAALWEIIEWIFSLFKRKRGKK